MVGNSRVEEHISKQALTDVYELQQHSQEPANIVEKMEVRVIDTVVLISLCDHVHDDL